MVSVIWMRKGYTFTEQMRHAEGGWSALHSELARSRRNQRKFTIIGVSDEVWAAPGAGPTERMAVGLNAAASVGNLLRTPDRAWLDGSLLHVLLTDCDRAQAEAFLQRARKYMPQLFAADGVRVAVFPEDGITVGALRPPSARLNATRRGGPDVMTIFARRIEAGQPFHRRLYPHARRYLGAKRVFDLVFCTVILGPVSAVAMLCALAIRLDSPGSILFTQVRAGKDGRPFRMYKFRTMVENAEELKASLAHLNVLPPPDFKVPNDPRVTRVGRFLRKTSLDELPQFINVLKGEMSLVGPRPCSIGVDLYALWHGERLEVPPGITGIWQLEGRHVSSFDERLRFDIKYIEEMSLLLDVKLIMRTVLAVFKGSGS